MRGIVETWPPTDLSLSEDSLDEVKHVTDANTDSVKSQREEKECEPARILHAHG